MTDLFSAIVDIIRPLFGNRFTNISDLIALFACLFVIIVPFLIVYKVLDSIIR